MLAAIDGFTNTQQFEELYSCYIKLATIFTATFHYYAMPSCMPLMVVETSLFS